MANNWRHSILAVFLWIFIPPGIQADEFHDRYNALQILSMNDIGRDAKVEKCHRMLWDYFNHPDRAQVMLLLGSMYEADRSEFGIEPDKAEAIKWFATACDAAEHGTDLWCEARILASIRFREAEPEGKERAKVLLSEVHTYAPNILWEVRAEIEMQLMASMESDLKTVVEIFDRIQARYADQTKFSHGPMIKSKFDELVYHSASLMMGSWASTDMVGRAERARRIEILARKYEFDFMIELREEALETSNSSGSGDDDPQVPIAQASAEIVAPTQVSRSQILWAIVGIISVFGGSFLWRRTFEKQI